MGWTDRALTRTLEVGGMRRRSTGHDPYSDGRSDDHRHHYCTLLLILVFRENVKNCVSVKDGSNWAACPVWVKTRRNRLSRFAAAFAGIVLQNSGDDGREATKESKS